MTDPRRRSGQLPAGGQAYADEAELLRMYGECVVQLHGCDKGCTNAAATLYRPRRHSLRLLSGQ